MAEWKRAEPEGNSLRRVTIIVIDPGKIRVRQDTYNFVKQNLRIVLGLPQTQHGVDHH